jgi:hypothetical protein
MNRIARSIIALCAPLTMPWPGPHVDRYAALLLVAINAPAEGVSPAFWELWAVLWIAYAVFWFVLLLLVRRLWCRGSKARGATTNTE